MKEIALILLLFFIGQLIHVLKRAGMAVRGKNGITTRRAYLVYYWDALAVRAFLAMATCLFILKDSAALAKLLSHFGISGVPDISVSPGSALIFGYFFDSMFDWLASKIPALGKELPPLNGSNGER